MSKVFVSCVIVFCCTLTLFAENHAAANDGLTFIYLVRHAEKQKGPDPVLTPEGEQRANNYSSLLRSSEIHHVFSTDYRRTRMTAGPLAERLDLDIEIYNPKKLDETAKHLLTLNHSVFVVGHSNTTRELTNLLGGAKGKPIDETSEYDRVYQLVVQNGIVIRTNRLNSSNR